MGLFSGRDSAGYGTKDARLARDLRAAKNEAEADKAARKDGHKDAKAARGWLRDRSR